MNKRLQFILFLFFITPLYSNDDVETIVIIGEEEEDNELPSQINTVTNDEIIALMGSSTEEIVASVMGVKLSKMGNEAGGSYISIRGSSPEQVLILINGKKLNSSQGGGVDL